MCTLGRGIVNFHDSFESLPGIITSYEVNLLKTKMLHNLRLIAANVIKNIQETDWTILEACGDYKRCASENAPVTGLRVSRFYIIFTKYV